MDVFIKNVPQQANEALTRKFLSPKLEQLSIKIYSLRKDAGKPFAILTFLNISDAQRFLARHGQTRVNGRLVNGPHAMVFLNKTLYPTPGNQIPDVYHLRSLELNAKQSVARSDLKQNYTTEQESEEGGFQALSFSCGIWDYDGHDLIFMSCLDWNLGGYMRFGSRKAIFKSGNNQIIAITYASIQHITASASGGSASMTFTLGNAPHFFGVDPLAALANLSINVGKSSERAKDVRLSSLGGDHELLAAGCWVYRFNFAAESFTYRLSKLRTSPTFPEVNDYRARVRSPSQHKGWRTQWFTLQTALSKTYHKLAFEILFQVQRIAQNGYIQPSAVVDLLPIIANMVGRSGVAITTRALQRFCRDTPFPGPNIEAVEFSSSSLVGYLREAEKRALKEDDWLTSKRKSENVAIIHRATVTPAGIYLAGPESENNNRVLRKYPNHHSHFLRVVFADEDNEPVRYDPKVDTGNIFYGRFKKVLNDGITIAGRVYKFLGFSHSSLRAQTCWFMAPFLLDGELIFDRLVIERLGQFTKIRSPAKCAARIGQAFSETPDIVELGDTTIFNTYDITQGDRVFSDGCGTISKKVLDKIWEALPGKRRVKPYLFQIRHAGAKGMLSFDSRLTGDVMCLRPSMTKFPSDDNKSIELCGAAYRPLPMYLNRQTIKIMEDLGVDPNWFMKLQAIAVASLRQSTINARNAAKFLESHSAGDVALIPKLIRKLGFCNWPFQADEFLSSVVETAVLVELRTLKHKTRILVEHGATLYGIMDETGTLREGEVFITTDTETWTQRVITGPRIVITRAPALHPGDIRIVKAVSLPEDHALMHLRNCIVFSQHGDRDLPSQLSGGDLDGDLYNVIWDTQCQLKLLYTPADYPRQDPIDIMRAVTREDMTDFFVKFMENDQLGRIATNHLVLADQKDDGTVHPDCIKLAEMHSTAVDYSKTGIPVDMTKMPRYSRYRPDFMAPGPHVTIGKKEIVFSEEAPGFGELKNDDAHSLRYYESNKILGKLYRAIDERDVFKQVHLSGRQDGPDIMRTAWSYIQRRCKTIQWEHLKEWARDIRDLYEDCVRDIILNYSPHHLHPVTEVEVVVGNILGKTGAQSKRQRDLSTSMKEQYDRDVSFTIDSITKDGTVKSAEALERGMACFAVSFEVNRTKNVSEERLRSFMYVAAAVCFREVEGI